MREQRQIKPLVEAVPLEARPPGLGDNTADLDRLRRGLAEFTGNWAAVPWRDSQRIADEFRAAEFSGAAIIDRSGPEDRVISFRKNTPEILPGLALDLGTTHLEASLVDMRSGRHLAAVNSPNPQIVHGDDILSRIHFATRGNGLGQLRAEINSSIATLAGRLAAEVGCGGGDICALCVSGNTTMSHFFLGLNPYHLIREPYIPVVNLPDPVSAAELGLENIHPAASVLVMPGVGSYFGDDLLSGIIASDLDRGEKAVMLIDVGTNAEVVVGNRDWLLACAGAAGPALEGGVARMGMRAGPGAIDRVRLAGGELSFTTIDDAPARGICGSGVIDLVAALYLGRFIDMRGEFVPARCGERLVESEDGAAFVLVSGKEAADGEPVLFTQVDLDAVMRSKAAMYSILSTITAEVGCEFTDLEKIFVAGAFGRHIDPESAITIGMMPDLPRDRFVPLGNTSLAGAERLLSHRDDLARLKELVGRITYIELNVNQEFMLRFSGCRFIPHTDRSLFPSVPFFD